MRKYELLLEASGTIPATRVELFAMDASVAFSWAERNAQGRRFEILEEGRSLGSAALSPGADFWALSPAAGRSAPRRDAPREQSASRPLVE